MNASEGEIGPTPGSAQVDETDPDVVLMRAFCAGDEDAFVTLYRTHRDRMIAYSYRLLRDQALAEEAAQDVFLKLYRARETYEPRSRFSTFLFRIATNHCFNLRARADHALTRADDTLGSRTPSPQPSPHEQLAHRELQGALQQALASLPGTQQAAFLLCHYEGLSYRETAETLDTTEGAIKSLVFRAREALAQRLTPITHLEGGRHVV